MKLNHGLVLAAALVVGSLATGCSKSADEDATDEGATTEQATVAGEQGSVQAVATNKGFTQDACPQRVSDARRVERAGFRRGEHLGFRRGERVGFRLGERRAEGWVRGDRGVRRAWWRFW